MNIAFMGSDPIALPMLDYIQSEACADTRITAVFTQPDRRTGRGMQLHANEIKSWALAQSIEVLQPVKCGEAEAEIICNKQIDLVLVMAYGQILPGCILRATRNKVLNLHASLLPRLRGASPIHTAIALGLEKTGVSMMEIVPKLDAGPVADRQQIRIPGDAQTGAVIELMSQAAIPLVERTLQKLRQGRLEFVEQDAEHVTYCRIIEKTDRYLDFHQSATELYNRIRAFQPWPGTAFPAGAIEIRIHDAAVERADDPDDPPGTVRHSANGLLIACGRDYLRPTILQRPGGKPMPVAEFLRGYPITDGQTLQSREMRPLEAAHPFPYRKK